MIDLYYWPTPNGWKVSIMLEELGLDYTLKLVDLGKGEQMTPSFLAISPNGRMPAIVDHDAEGGPLSLFESGTILTYLADKSGRFLPYGVERYRTLQWLFWQVANLGPAGGQLAHFRNYVPDASDYARERFADEYDRLLKVIDGQLQDRDYLCGDYSIADMAAWPWILGFKVLGATLAPYPNVADWRNRIKERPAVRRGVDLGKQERSKVGFEKGPSEDARKIMYGQKGDGR